MPPCNGYPEIEETCRRGLSPLSASQHIISNVVAEVHGDTADAVCYLQAQHVRDSVPGGEQFMVGGRYTDKFVRTEDGWRIKTRILDYLWTSGNPGVFDA